MAGAPGARDIWAGEMMESGGSLVQSASEDEQLAFALNPLQRRRWLVAKKAIFATAIGVALVVAVVVSSAGSKPPRDDAEAGVQLFGVAALATAASTLSQGAAVLKEVQGAPDQVESETNSFLKPFEELKQQLKEKPGVSKLVVNLTEMANLTRQEMLHPKDQDRHDGNVCPDDEELHADLCYKRCSLLTAGKYPIRTTAFACCMEEPCSFFNTKFTSPLTYCAGFDVSGNAEGKECPHAPGSCMVDEEFNLGMCYKKCAILTNNTFPFRSAAATCCRYSNHIACLDALNTMTKPEFMVGGGMDDGRAATPNMTHAPMQRLTESGVPHNVDISAFVAAGGTQGEVTA